MAGAELICPNCKFTFTLPVRSLSGRVPCPMCKTPIPTSASPRREGPHGFDRPEPFARPQSPTANGHGPHRAPQPPPSPPSPPSGSGEGWGAMPPRPAPDAPTWNDPPNVPVGPRAELSDVGLLLARSWETFKVRAPTLVGLYLLAGLMALVPLAIGAGVGAILSAATPGGILVGLAAGAVGSLWAGGWGLAAFFLAVSDDALSVGAALAAAKARAWSFAWLLVIVAFAVMGGIFLLVVPGIVFAVWFTFAPFAFVEGSRGMAALLRSRALVAGHGWQVLARLVVVGLLGAVLGSVPGLGFLLGIAFAPFQVLVSRHLFEELREKKPNARVDGAVRARILAGGLFGHLAAVSMLIALASSSGGPGIATFLKVGLATLQGDPEAAAAHLAATRTDGDPDAPPQGFGRGIGTWRGTAPETGAEWIVTLAPPDRVDVRASAEEFYSGRARALTKLGVEEDGLPVLPGGGLFDLAVEESSDPEAAGKIMLGSWKLEGTRELKLCLGRPGGFQRTSEFPAGLDFLCVALGREGE